MAMTGHIQIQYINNKDSHFPDTSPSVSLIEICRYAFSPVFHFSRIFLLSVINLPKSSQISYIEEKEINKLIYRRNGRVTGYTA